jgi:hypothetical protein
MNDETRDLLAVWALDAVELDERDQLEARTAEDTELRAAADEFRATAAYLALADDRVSEPVAGELWDRIVAATGAEPGATADEMASALVLAPAPAVVTPLRRRPHRVVWASAGVAAAALMLVIGVAIGRDQQPNISQEAALWANAQRNGQTVTLSNDSAPLARVAILPNGTGVLRNDALPELPEGKTYQLWAVVGDDADPTVISAGVLGRTITDEPVTFVGDPSKFVLTIEDAPGVAVSQQVATAAGSLA